jgi:hypothetical protein
MDYYLESHLPHALQFMRCKHNEDGATNDVGYPEEVVVTIPAGTDPKHVVKLNDAQKAFLEEDKEFKKLLTLNKFGIRWVNAMPSRMLSESERMEEMKRKINEQNAEIARLKARV